MVFGLTHWLISFVIFLIVLTLITWSSVHLGKKDQNATDIISLRLFDTSDHSIKRESSITSRLIEHTVGPTLFADDQGSEIPDSAEFYNLVKTLINNKNNTADNTQRNDNVITISSVINNDTVWSEDIATTIFTPSIIKNNTTWSEDAAITSVIPSVISNKTTQWKKEDTTNAAFNASDKASPILIS